MDTSVVEWTSVTIFEKVKDALVDALGIDDDEVSLNARIFADLGAESIDFLDINFRLQGVFGRNFSRSELFGKYSGDSTLKSELTEEVLEEIRRTFPLPKNLSTDQVGAFAVVGDLFTVRLLCQCVARILKVQWEDPC